MAPWAQSPVGTSQHPCGALQGLPRTLPQPLGSTFSSPAWLPLLQPHQSPWVSPDIPAGAHAHAFSHPATIGSALPTNTRATCPFTSVESLPSSLVRLHSFRRCPPNSATPFPNHYFFSSLKPVCHSCACTPELSTSSLRSGVRPSHHLPSLPASSD
jgi:hypothetical protein